MSEKFAASEDDEGTSRANAEEDERSGGLCSQPCDPKFQFIGSTLIPELRIQELRSLYSAALS